MSNLVYKKIQFHQNSNEGLQLQFGTYQPPDGWRVHSMTVSEGKAHYAEWIHLLLEASIPSDTPYRG